MRSRPVARGPRRADPARRRVPRRADAGPAAAVRRGARAHRRRPRRPARRADPGAGHARPRRSSASASRGSSLGVAVYPAAWFLARWYTPAGRAHRAGLRRGRRVLVSNPLSLARRRPRLPHHPRRRRPRACGCRGARATSTSPVAPSPRGSTPRRSAVSTSRRRASSASPGSSTTRASTCCGCRSATPWATSSCSSSWRPRCAARAPTPCPTSPRPGSGPARSGSCRRRSSSASAGSTSCPQFQGASLTLTLVTGRPGLGRRLRRHGRHRARGRRGRHALDHLRAGRAVLDQAHRPGGARVRAARPVVPLGLPCATGRPVVAHPARPRRPRTTTRPTARHPRCSRCASGTMGLPHVLVRYYTNPDGIGARRTTVTVIALLGIVLPPASDLRRRSAGSPTRRCRRASARTPSSCGCRRRSSPAWPASCSRRCWRAGRSRRSCPRHPASRCRSPASSTRSCCARGSPASPAATCPASAGSGSPPSWRSSIPYALSRVTEPLGLATTVGLAFAVAAATFAPAHHARASGGGGCPRGGRWPGSSSGARRRSARSADDHGRRRPAAGWTGALLANPAMWATPLAIATAVIVSLATPVADPGRDDAHDGAAAHPRAGRPRARASRLTHFPPDPGTFTPHGNRSAT